MKEPRTTLSCSSSCRLLFFLGGFMLSKIDEIESNIKEDNFDNLYNYCKKAKDIVLSWAIDLDYNTDLGDFLINYGLPEKLTPIEQIFYVSFFYFISFNEKIRQYDKYFPDKPPMSFLIEDLFSIQKPILFGDNIYIVDFVLDFSQQTTKGDYWFPSLKDLKYAIELDGYEFHSNKKQMNYDYQRENNLKKLGYKIIRFTGSQVYNNPMKTIETLFDIIFNDFDKEIKNGK